MTSVGGRPFLLKTSTVGATPSLPRDVVLCVCVEDDQNCCSHFRIMEGDRPGGQASMLRMVEQKDGRALSLGRRYVT